MYAWGIHSRNRISAAYRDSTVFCERVTVVVVADVVVVELGRSHPLVLGADPAVVPVSHDDVAVRIERRDHDGDRVVEDLQDLVVGPCRKVIHDLCSRLTRRDLGRVEPVRLHEDDPAGLDRVVDLGLRMAAGILKDRVQSFELVEIGEVLR